jgi:signal transduction histidine kinase/DNA-binding response OmpR family regulator/ligand-binding sensor domain-containing protein
MKKKNACLFMFVFYVFLLNAQNGMNFRILDVKNGITDNYIQDILRDDYGFVWFATTNGLNRYDGYHFKQYNTAQRGSYYNNIESLAEDAGGTMWVKAPLHQFYYDVEHDCLRKNIEYRLNKLGIRDNTNQIIVDEDRNLWCLSSKKLYYYNFRIKKLSILLLGKGYILSDVACRHGKGFVLFSNGKLGKIDIRRQRISICAQTTLHTGFHPRLYMDQSMNVWLYVTHGSQIECYSSRQQKWIKFPHQNENAKNMNNITSVTDDGKGNVWIGTDDNGIFVYNFSSGTSYHIYKETNDVYSLPSNHVTCFFKDKSNIMWVGSSKKGVAYTFLNKMMFRNSSFPHKQDVSCINEDKNGHIWFGFDGEGIAMRQGSNYKYYTTTNSQLPSDLIVSSYLDTSGRMWWGSFGGGAFYQDGNAFHRLSIKNDIGRIGYPYYIRRITEDRYGNLWFASYAQGLYVMNRQGIVKNFSTGNSILRNNYIADISCRDGKYMYVATGSGMNIIDLQSQKIYGLPLFGKDSNFANCLHLDCRGLLWIGGRYGVEVLNTKTKKIQRLTTANGLSNPYIRAITEDKYNNIWLSTDHGITHIMVSYNYNHNRYEYYCMPYYEQDGIDNYTFNNFSISDTSNGDIYIGGSGGYVCIKPEPTEDNTSKSKVVFTALYVADKYVDADTPLSDGRIILKRNIQLLNEINLDYTDTNFALEVSALDYYNLHKLQYFYRLSMNDKWALLEGNRIYFNKLSPGTYHLQVKIGIQGKDISTMIIKISPPWWLSTWALLIYLLLITAGAVITVKYYQRKHIRILHVQRHEMEIAQQHEMDEEKLRFFTNVSHDLRTPLSLIITPIESILKFLSPGNIRETLEMVYRNAQTLQNEIEQLLDFRKLDQQKEGLSLSYGDLATFVEEICTSMQILSQSNDISIYTKIDSRPIETCFDRNKMQRILLNLLSNAMKYNIKDGSITVTVDKITNDTGECACIQVADTGIGISNENKGMIFNRYFQVHDKETKYKGSGIGLHIVKEYASMMGGTVSVKDNTPRGSIFIITIPIEKQENANTGVSAEESSKVKETTNILIVDDNNDFRSFLSTCLKDDYHIYQASDGKEALSILSNTDIQLVISDVMMPVMDGMELCRRIKTDIKFSHVPVILLTARSAENHIVEGLKEGADDYITKPFKIEILLLRIRKILELVRNNKSRFKEIDVSPEEITISTPDEQFIKKAIKLVEDNMENTEYSVEELSSELNISRGHLYKKLIAITGKSPVEFIRTIRVKRGRQLLDNKETSVSQISYRIGMSPQLFSKYFREEFGCTPTDYIKRTKIL